MYFKFVLISAYPQHSGERYRTIGPLVDFIDLNLSMLLRI